MQKQKKVLLVGVDESHASFYSLEWAIDHLRAPYPHSIFKVVLIHVKLPAVSILRVSGPGIGGDILPTVEADLKKTAIEVVDKAKELCKRKSVTDFHAEIFEGDARNALCQAVEKYHADILVVGSHGHGVFRRAILGSVSDYCAHHAHCTVMIVKKPKSKETPSN